MPIRHGPYGTAVVLSPAHYIRAADYAAALRRAALADQACAVMLAHLADPDFTPDALASALGISMALLKRIFTLAGGVASTMKAIRLDAALLALASRPPTLGVVADLARAHGFRDPCSFSEHFAKRFGRGPSEVLAMRSVWPEARLRGWLGEKADRHGFRARLDTLVIERGSMVRVVASRPVRTRPPPPRQPRRTARPTAIRRVVGPFEIGPG